MKYTLVLLLFILSNVGFGQTPFIFPSNLEISPNNFILKGLKIKKIEQLSKIKFQSDSVFRESFLDFVLEYDSIGNLQTLKYDFAKESFFPPISLGGAPRGIEIHGNDKLYSIYNENDTVVYNYNECQFTWTKNRLESVSFQYAKKHSGYDRLIGDWGSFSSMESTSSSLQSNIETTYIDGRLIEKRIFYDSKLKTISIYQYIQFKKNNINLYLLDTIDTSSLDENGNNISKQIKQIKYSF